MTVQPALQGVQEDFAALAFAFHSHDLKGNSYYHTGYRTTKGSASLGRLVWKIQIAIGLTWLLRARVQTFANVVGNRT